MIEIGGMVYIISLFLLMRCGSMDVCIIFCSICVIKCHYPVGVWVLVFYLLGLFCYRSPMQAINLYIYLSFIFLFKKTITQVLMLSVSKK